MYELFLLGKLLARSWYGYEFQRALSGFVGPQRRVSWGTIYPLFRRLERDRLIRAVPVHGSRDGRDKQAYTITAAGKRRFLELMRTERPYDSDFRETFRMKLGHFSRVETEVCRQIVAAYMERLASIHQHTSRTYSVVGQIPEMGEEERQMILHAIHHERSLAEGEMAWLQKELAEFLPSK